MGGAHALNLVSLLSQSRAMSIGHQLALARSQDIATKVSLVLTSARYG